VTDRIRRVGAHLALDVQQPVRLILQLSVFDPSPGTVTEELRVACDGREVAVEEIVLPGGTRAHILRPPTGRLTVDYDAVVCGDAAEPTVTEADRLVYLCPSRYAESDRLAATARSEFAGITGAVELLAAVSSWVGSRLSYVPGSSGPTDGSVDTLLLRQGVCRDYAHLVIALLRALDVPARLTAVYAPGLQPMDFHAVAEALVDERWRVVDATLLAPRRSLVRIATGRDAADTAFLSAYEGRCELLEMQVRASVDGDLPIEDVTELVSIS
jgi:transglutaminase-like putative cysteine protease